MGVWRFIPIWDEWQIEKLGLTGGRDPVGRVSQLGCHSHWVYPRSPGLKAFSQGTFLPPTHIQDPLIGLLAEPESHVIQAVQGNLKDRLSEGPKY